MAGRLLWKVLAVNLPAIGLVAGAMWFAVDYLAADYFTVLMNRYGISPVDSHRMFLDAVHRYLLGATLGAAVLAMGLSFWLTRRVLRPLGQMTEAADRIAAGDYSRRAAAPGRDEVARLARAFNRMADGLERLERLRRTMVADVAHELRTPITNIRGYLEALEDGVVPPSEETLATLREETLRLASLVEQLLELARADAARAYLRREPVALPDAAAEVLATLAPRIEAKGLAVQVQCAPDARTVVADRDRLLQVLHHLADNATRHAPEGTTVAVRTERVGGGVRTRFENRCGGIPEEDLPLVFERFFRVDRSRSRRAGGAGIGLAIVKELVEAHGGAVGAESDGDAVRVWFDLPDPPAAAP